MKPHPAVLRLVFVCGLTWASAASAADLERAAPEAVGLDEAQLSQLTEDIRAGDYVNIHGLLVVRHGKLAWEAYFAGPDERRGESLGVVSYDATKLHDARSVTKSVVSMLFGAAIGQGAIETVDAPVLNSFPEYQDLRAPERMKIHLHHALAMTSGLAWDESSRPYGDPLNSETAMDRAGDPYRYVLQQPVVSTPGARWEYSGGDTMLLAAVIERAVGMDLAAYAEQALFAPLGIERYEWLTYPDGTPIAASGLRLLPRDMAKLGLLYLTGGRWDGKQIIPKFWVEASLKPRAVIAERPFGFQRYGYQWWLGTARVNSESVPFAMAVGWGGQRIMLVPSMNLVAVVTAGLYGDRRQTDITFEILLDRVLPTVTAR